MTSTHHLRGPLLTLWLLILGLSACGDAETPAGDPPAPQADMEEQATCRDDSDCSADQYCDQGLCAPDPLFCSRNSDCPEGFLCQRETLRCARAQEIDRPCSDSTQCFADEACVDGLCGPMQDMGTPDLPTPDMDSPDPEPDLPPEDLAEPDLTPDLPPEDMGAQDLMFDLPEGDLSEPDLTPDLPPEDTHEPDLSPDLEPDLPEEDLSEPDLTPDLPPEDMHEPDLEPDLPPEDLFEPDLQPDLPPEDIQEPDLTPDLPPEDVQEPDLEPDLPPEDMQEPDLEPDLPPEDMQEPDLEPDLPPEDMAQDSGPDVVEDMGADMMAEMDTGADVPDMFEPPPTPAPGVYSYQRMEIGGLEALSHVIFHPDGDYALALEARDVVHVIQWNPQTGQPQTTRLVMPNASPSYAWRDIKFDPSGQFALLVGAREADPGSYGFVVKFNDAAWRAGAPTSEVLTDLTGLNLPDPVQSLRYPWEGGDPVLLMRADRGLETIRLRSLDTDAERLGAFGAQTEADAGCDDLAFVENEEGGPGIVVVCGENGADVHYYSMRQGQWGWEANPGNNNLGNTSSVGAHRGQGYALIISWSGRAIYRFEGGLLGAYGDAIRFSTRQIRGVAFQQEGQRALIHGGSYFGGEGRENIAVLYEYRHNEFTCARPNTEDCDVRPVHIQDFHLAPYNAIRNTQITDVAWKPGCDGGILSASYTDWQTSNGQIIAFQIEGGRPCF